jgi:hypothetical protein
MLTQSFCYLIGAVLTVAGTAQTPPVFVPPSCAQLDGRSLGAWPGLSQRFRMQVLLKGTSLSSLANRTIAGIAVRRDGQYLPAHAGGRASVVISLSHARLAPDAASPAFAANRGLDATEVFRGEIVVPDAPALTHRDQVTWQSPHAIEFLFTTSFSYRGGDLCLEVEGSPVAAATSPWWPIDYDLFTHDAQAAPLGSNCDPKCHATVSRETLLPGGTVSLHSMGPLQATGLAMIDVSILNPGIDLGFLGATNCMARVLPTLMLNATHQPPASGGHGGAFVDLTLPQVNHLLGASLYAQWLAFPNPVNPARLTTTNALALQVSSQPANLVGVVIKSDLFAEPTPLPATGRVLPQQVPVLCFRIR